jgi:putative membrane-bound dehydrogenase-like protein
MIAVMHWPNRLASVLSAIGIVTRIASAAHPVASPGQYQLHPALELSLFAMEPDVVDPVALTFDEFGRMYVVEMRDYPYGFGPDRKPGGTIRLLEDVDENGRADQSTVFAENLSFPTSIAPWNGGVLVTAPPEILFLKDTDGDGKADLREVIIGGLELGVTDSNVNGLRWALDNWVHVINGGNGGSATSPKRPEAGALELGSRDFRLSPATGEIELTTHTGGGFGLVFDNWGHSFTTHNINHIKQRIADADYFADLSGLPPLATTQNISDHGDMARIYPISRAETRPNHPEQAGHFSSAGGMGFIGHLEWPEALQGSVLVCDVVGNIVHRDVLSPAGPIFKASRAPDELDREFFASRDNSFRPVGLEPGPDGALYLIDMQRDVIEHPDYIPAKLLEKQDIRAGDDRGRVYRIQPRGWKKRRELPGRASAPELVRMLDSANPWTRLTAQRLLVSMGDTNGIVELLSQRGARVVEKGGHGRVHALWALHGLGKLTEPLLLGALEDPNPHVRAQAIAISEGRLSSSPGLRGRIAEAATDPHAEVRFRAALAAGSGPVASGSFIALRLLAEDGASEWIRRAALTSLRSGDWSLPVRLGFMPEAAAKPSNLSSVFVDLYAVMAGRLTTNDTARLEQIVEALLTLPHVELQRAALEGLAAGLERTGVRPPVSEDTRQRLAQITGPRELLTAAWRLCQQLGIPVTPAQREAGSRALRDAANAALTLEERLAAIEILGLADFSEVGPSLLALLDSSRQPSAIQEAAFSILRGRREPEVAVGLIKAWRTLAPGLRPAAVNLLVYRQAFHGALLGALEDGRLQMGELNLDLEHRRQLLREAERDIRQRAARFMGDEEYSNRKEIVEQWLARLPNTGDPARGRALFERICAQCHYANGLGHRVGPDLSSVSHRSVEDLLSNVLDPNMAMEPSYVAYTADLTDGEEETGLLVGETGTSVTLLQALERRAEIPRSRIRALRANGRSLMPEGLEAGLTPEDLRDLIAFIQAPGTGGASSGGTP